MSSKPLKIISINVQEQRNRDRVIPFLQKIQPEAILVQEMLADDLPLYEATLGMRSLFTPMGDIIFDDAIRRFGLAIFTKLEIQDPRADYYFGHPDKIPSFTVKEPEKPLRALLSATVRKGQTAFRLITTHFTWTPHAKPNEKQLRDLDLMLNFLQKESEFILTGDFNAPRGGPVFDKIATRYKDNIPSHVTSTLDKNLHQAKGLEIVIDGLFTTPAYHVDTIEIQDGLSDHVAIIATISRLSLRHC